MKTWRTRGLVVRCVSYSDSSQVVTAFTKDLGIVAMLARGALRLPRRSSSFNAPFDLAGWYDLVLRARGGELHLALEGRLLEPFGGLRRELARYLDCCLALEVMPLMFSPADPHPDLLRGALSYFKLLAHGEGRRALRIHFHSLLLAEGGLAPQWATCVECGAEPREKRLAFRVPHGIACRACRLPGDVEIEAAVARYLALESTAPWERVPRLDPGAEILTAAWNVLAPLLVHHLERRVRSLRYVPD